MVTSLNGAGRGAQFGQGTTSKKIEWRISAGCTLALPGDPSELLPHLML